MSGVFLSYRRSDSSQASSDLYQQLVGNLGSDRVFRDLDSIVPAEDFAASISDRLGTCRALVCVIGPRWLDARDKQGRRRIDDPGDFVRIEIASALQRGVPVLPVLLDGAPMPPEDVLPKDIGQLARSQALVLQKEGTSYRYELVIEAVAALVSPKAKPAAQSSSAMAIDGLMSYVANYINDYFELVLDPEGALPWNDSRTRSPFLVEPQTLGFALLSIGIGWLIAGLGISREVGFGSQLTYAFVNWIFLALFVHVFCAFVLRGRAPFRATLDVCLRVLGVNFVASQFVVFLVFGVGGISDAFEALLLFAIVQFVILEVYLFRALPTVHGFQRSWRRFGVLLIPVVPFVVNVTILVSESLSGYVK